MLSSGLPEIVGDDEDLARFLTQSGHFRKHLVRPSAFLPRANDKETSVSRHGNEPRERLWELGLTAAGSRPLYGAALIKAADVRAVQLDVVEREPPPRHAGIVGWPWENDPELQKARQKELATVIASAAGPPLLR